MHHTAAERLFFAPASSSKPRPSSAKSTVLTFHQPTGTLGLPVLKTFLASIVPAFHLTLLTQDVTKAQSLLDDLFKQQGVTFDPGRIAIEVIDDYRNRAALCSTLEGKDALVILLNRSLGDQQIALIDAAIAARVPHIIPSSYGVGVSHPYLRSSPPLEEKVKMLDHLHSAIVSQPTPPIFDSNPGRKTTFTAIDTGVFLELAMQMYFLINLKAAHDDDEVTRLFDGGNTSFTISSLADIAIATKNAVVLGVADDERVRNRTLNIQTFSTTQNELLTNAKQLAPGKPWKTLDMDTKVLEKMSNEKYEKGERSADAMRGYLVRGTFGLGLGMFEKVHNDILGVKELDAEGVKEVLRKYM